MHFTFYIPQLIHSKTTAKSIQKLDIKVTVFKQKKKKKRKEKHDFRRAVGLIIIR